MKKQDNQTFSTHISQLIASDKISEAMEVLDMVVKQLDEEAIGQEVILLKGRWESLEKGKRNKTLRTEEIEVRHNQIRVSILSLSDMIVEDANEKGIALSFRVIENTQNPKSSFPAFAKYGISFSSILLLFAISFIFFGNKQKRVCPFPENSSKYHILLIPFEELGLEKKEDKSSDAISLAVKNRFEEMQTNEQLPLDVRIGNKAKINAHTFNQRTSLTYAQGCNANLVLSGLYEKAQVTEINSLIITFKYLARGVQGNDSMFTISGMEQHQINSLSSLIHGSFPGKIEDIIYWALGIKEFEVQNYTKALAHFDAIHPTNEESHLKVALAKAEITQRIGNYREAFGKYEKLVLKSSQLDKHQKLIVFNNIAVLALELNQPDLANQHIEEAIKLDGQNDILQRNYQIIRQIQLQDTNQMSVISPNSENASLQLLTSTKAISEKIELELMDEKLSQADTLKSEHSTNVASNAKQNLTAGIEARKQKNYQSAIEYLNASIQQDSKQYVSYLERGYAYLRLQKYELALADYNQAIKLNPMSADAFLRRGELFRKMGQYQLALDDFERLKTFGKSKEFFAKTAQVYYNQKLYQQAINMVDQALLINPNDRELNNFRHHLRRKAESEIHY